MCRNGFKVSIVLIEASVTATKLLEIVEMNIYYVSLTIKMRIIRKNITKHVKHEIVTFIKSQII